MANQHKDTIAETAASVSTMGYGGDGPDDRFASAACHDPHTGALAQTLKAKLDYEQLMNCMRCGFCLPACPTYRETGIEAESPRGRIALMKAVADGIMQPDLAFEEQMNHCLGCRACEPACPAGVKYGQLIEQARDAVEDHTTCHKGWVKALRKIAFKQMFPHQKRMKLVGSAMRLYQRSGLQQVVRTSKLLSVLPKHLQEMERILPEASGQGVVDKIGDLHPAKGETIARVGLFRGCIMDVMFTETNVHTVELLTAAGFEVVIPRQQNCCGALHAHSGEKDDAKELAKRNIRAFREAGVDYVVSNAGGCGALLIEYDHLLQGEADWEEDAHWFARRVIDVSELLVKRGRKLQFADGGQSRITYQDSCHLRNVMQQADAPRRLLGSIEGAQYIEMKEADRCCGSAGIYNITQPEMAGQILQHKMEHACQTEADYMVTSNPGCLLQMKLGIDKYDQTGRMKAVHIVDVLHERLLRDEG